MVSIDILALSKKCLNDGFLKNIATRGQTSSGISFGYLLESNITLAKYI
jgi:hypothetical protein